MPSNITMSYHPSLFACRNKTNEEASKLSEREWNNDVRENRYNCFAIWPMNAMGAYTVHLSFPIYPIWYPRLLRGLSRNFKNIKVSVVEDKSLFGYIEESWSESVLKIFEKESYRNSKPFMFSRPLLKLEFSTEYSPKSVAYVSQSFIMFLRMISIPERFFDIDYSPPRGENTIDIVLAKVNETQGRSRCWSENNETRESLMLLDKPEAYNGKERYLHYNGQTDILRVGKMTLKELSKNRIGLTTEDEDEDSE